MHVIKWRRTGKLVELQHQRGTVWKSVQTKAKEWPTQPNPSDRLSQQSQRNLKKLSQKGIWLLFGISKEGSKPELLARAANISHICKTNTNLERPQYQPQSQKILLHAPVLSIFLCACEALTLTSDLQWQIQSMEMRLYQRLLGISYQNHITFEQVRERIKASVGHYEDWLNTNYNGMAVWPKVMVFQKHSFREESTEEEEEADRGRKE